MSKIIKAILIGFTVLLCVAALYWFCFQPLLANTAHTADQVRVKQAELRLIKIKVARLADLKKALRNAQVEDQTSIQTIPSKLYLAELYNRIDSLTGASGLKVRQISATQDFQVFEKDNRLKYLAVNIEGNAYFPQVIRFLDLVSQSKYLLQVESLDLTSVSKGNKPRLHFKMTLNAFEYSADSV